MSVDPSCRWQMITTRRRSTGMTQACGRRGTEYRLHYVLTGVSGIWNSWSQRHPQVYRPAYLHSKDPIMLIRFVAGWNKKKNTFLLWHTYDATSDRLLTDMYNIHVHWWCRCPLTHGIYYVCLNAYMYNTHSSFQNNESLTCNPLLILYLRSQCAYFIQSHLLFPNICVSYRLLFC